MKKMTATFCTALCSLSLLGQSLSAEPWQPAKGPLMTRWAKDVAPDKALPEYPRPQMVRPEWFNLNGLWEYAITDKKSDAAPQSFQGKILVPFPAESALSGVMKAVKPDNLLWYRRTFDVPASFAGKRILLPFGAVDWQSTVYVNDKEVVTHKGGYDSFTVDITDALKPTGPQQLALKVYDPTEGGQPRGKQSLHPEGCFYTPCSGIWQTVWLEPVAAASIANLQITPDVDAGLLKLIVAGQGTKADQTIEAVAMEEGREIARVSGKLGEVLALPIKQPKLWSPQRPFLYDLKVTLLDGGKPIDSVDSYFGMRKFSLSKDAKGVQRLLLNGEPVFQTGPLDQGFWPDGIYTAPTDEALRFDIEMTRKLGFNVTRKHVKIEPERWYYWCDKLGLPVWQDMPAGDNPSAENKAQFEVELKRMIEQHRNHPSIVMWVVFNEGWGQFDTERLTKMVKEMDPSRLVNNASGWTDKNVGDVIDMHNYPGPGAPKTEPTRAAVLGEFGGLGAFIQGHLWTPKTWGYRVVAPDALTRSYAKLLTNAYGLEDSAGLCAAIYTQITDVETECNGLFTYDREVLKVDLEKTAKANRGELLPTQLSVVVPTARQSSVVWRYTAERPAENWFQPDFNASAWKEGPGGFGTKATLGAVVGTEWKTGDIWLRREFDFDRERYPKPVLYMHHDEDAEVYINGVLAAKLTDYVTDYEEVVITPEGLAALKTGKNLMAVHCHNREGGQNIDVGIVQEVTLKPAARAPAVPLVVHDPYFSIWSPSDKLAESMTRHWTGGAIHALCGMVRIDGKTYRIMGAKPQELPAMYQTNLKILPTRTIYEFKEAGIHLTLTFTTPVLPNDLDVLSRPVTYLSWDVRSLDNQEHQVSLYYDNSAELVVNTPDQKVVWSRPEVPGLKVLRIGSQDQPVLQKAGDDLRIDWGYLYVAAPTADGLSSVIAQDEKVRDAFAKSGRLPEGDDTRMPRAVKDEFPVAAYAFDLGKVGGQSVARHLMLAYDDIYSIEYLGQKLRPYWRRNGMEAAELLQVAEKQFADLAGRCKTFDEKLVADLTRAGGEGYANLCALSYRQAIGGHKLAAAPDGRPLLFSKECFSNGCIATVDVIYPAAPIFMFLSNDLLKASVTPVFDYAAMDRWKFPFAPHDLGTYPKANGQVYGGGEKTEENQMPVEESGNMLIIAAVICQLDGNTAYVNKYWPQLARWAAYLKEKGLDPPNQLCTDDFAGHLAHNANLSIKAIMALGAYAKMCDMAGKKDEAVQYRRTAETFAREWIKMADNGDHYRLAFDRAGTWSQKYNLVWDRLLDLKLFPLDVAAKEITFYKTKLNRFGLPLDNRANYTKTDWETWTATLAATRADFDALMKPVYEFVNHTPQRVPLTDWYETKDARQVGFQARTVIGGVFIKMLDDPAVWNKWVQEASKASK